jgi:hypothetical protein
MLVGRRKKRKKEREREKQPVAFFPRPEAGHNLLAVPGGDFPGC